MANQGRARSPSANALNHPSSTSGAASSSSSNVAAPHSHQFDPSFAPADNTSLAFNDQILFADAQYPSFEEQHNKLQQQHSSLASQGAVDLSYLQSQTFVAPGATTGLAYNETTLAAHGSSAFPSFDFNQTDFAEDTALDPSLLADFDASQSGVGTTGASHDHMAASMQHSAPTPPHLMPDMARRQSQSPSPHASPVFQPPSFGRPRGVSDSLDPSSAMYPQAHAEWSNMGTYRTTHRRTPSDQYSDYSSHSNQASPYMPTYDSFEGNAHASPLLNSQQDPVFSDALDLQQFTLSENQVPQVYQVAGHSPHLSPQIPPRQHDLPVYAENNFGLTTAQFGQQHNGLEMFPGTGHEAFPQLHKPQSPSEFGQADQMSPPEINVEYAPPTSATPNQVVRPSTDAEALSPPARTQSRNRIRAKSDPYGGSRSPSPGLQARGRSPSLQPQMTNTDSLSPFDASPSRSPSPRGREKSATRGRSTSHASDQRDYILNLAEPERTPSNGVKDSGRVQKHPATFQCHLCPKRFTRAYNLRSHLRTHTDERPFVCTVCGKAFARQHDRKRHEGLHSGEKKFVCKGNLQGGGQWGCGRRFARADALGRHFRSEAGRVCIKPLLEEEAEERQKAWMAEQQQAQVAAGLAAPPQPLMSQPQLDMNTHFLPAVLLQQYPALAGIDWNALPQGPPPDEEAYSGRSSFEASSGGEYYDDMSEGEIGAFSNAQMGGLNDMAAMQQPGMGMQAQAGARQAQAYGVYSGQSTGDYLSDFEGR